MQASSSGTTSAQVLKLMNNRSAIAELNNPDKHLIKEKAHQCTSHTIATRMLDL